MRLCRSCADCFRNAGFVLGEGKSAGKTTKCDRCRKRRYCEEVYPRVKK